MSLTLTTFYSWDKDKGKKGYDNIHLEPVNPLKPSKNTKRLNPNEIPPHSINEINTKGHDVMCVNKDFKIQRRDDNENVA